MMDTTALSAAWGSLREPEADGARLYPLQVPNLANYLLALPEPQEAERDNTPLRENDFR